MMFLSQIKFRYRMILAGIAVLALLAGGFLLLNQKPNKPIMPASLDQEELAALVKPSVVRIIHHVTGEATMPLLDVDLNTLTVSAADKPKVTRKIDEYVSGSGFIVNSQGYILTNAHVISQQTVKELYIEDALRAALEDKAKEYKSEELNNLLQDEQAVLEFVKKSLSFMESQSSFKLSSSLVVLDPSSLAEDMSALLKQGFAAEVLSGNDNFLKDEKDIGLVKIEAADLPVMALGDDSNITVGNKIYVFGFPSTAEFNNRNPLESTFTDGIISAVKFSQNKDFQIFQTNAKISQGSSGGPLFNEKGEAVGLITFQTGDLSRTKGDNFAGAIPIRLAKTVLDKSGISNDATGYHDHFKAGLVYLHNGMCKKAIEELNLAGAGNPKFSADRYLSPYIQQCEQTVANSASIDNIAQLAVAKIRSWDAFNWFVVYGRIILVLIAALIFFLFFRRMSKDEKRLSELSEKVSEEKQQEEQLIALLKKNGIEIPLPEDELHSKDRLNLSIPHPHLVDYAKQARQVGLKEHQITGQLSKAGWNQEEITRALEHKEN